MTAAKGTPAEAGVITSAECRSSKSTSGSQLEEADEYLVGALVIFPRSASSPSSGEPQPEPCPKT